MIFISVILYYIKANLPQTLGIEPDLCIEPLKVEFLAYLRYLIYLTLPWNNLAGSLRISITQLVLRPSQMAMIEMDSARLIYADSANTCSESQLLCLVNPPVPSSKSLTTVFDTSHALSRVAKS